MITDDESNEILWKTIFSLGVNFLIQGQFQKAQTIFLGLMEIKPDDSTAAIAYGEALLRDGRVDKALNHFLELFLRFEPDSKLLLGAAKACVLAGKTGEAKELLYPLLEGQISATPIEMSIARSISLCAHGSNNSVGPDEQNLTKII